MLDIDEGESVLSCMKTGCVELTWQIPTELVYRAYTSMKRKHDELLSLAVQSLVCEEADEYAGLPILWRGQEVEEIGPIEPLPEHVRQEPYSLPQGFHWVTLSSTAMLRRLQSLFIEHTEHATWLINYYLTYPTTRHEWQISIQAGGKLVAVILAAPVNMHIGKEIKVFISSLFYCHKKYRFNWLKYILIKELVRRAHSFSCEVYNCKS